MNFEEILPLAHGTFEEQRRVLERSIIIINYCIIINNCLFVFLSLQRIMVVFSQPGSGL
jgi:hypothetical protein